MPFNWPFSRAISNRIIQEDSAANWPNTARTSRFLVVGRNPTSQFLPITSLERSLDSDKFLRRHDRKIQQYTCNASRSSGNLVPNIGE
jgi:hypothetical protein